MATRQLRRSEPPPRFRSGRSKSHDSDYNSHKDAGLPLDRPAKNSLHVLLIEYNFSSSLVYQTWARPPTAPRQVSVVLSVLGMAAPGCAMPAHGHGSIPLLMKIQGPLRSTVWTLDLPRLPSCPPARLSSSLPPGWKKKKKKRRIAPPQPHLSQISIFCHGIRQRPWAGCDGPMQLPRGSLAHSV